jgi:hypothetical protein
MVLIEMEPQSKAHRREPHAILRDRTSLPAAKRVRKVVEG